MDEGAEQQPRIPGVRYRQVKRERYVDVEFAGEVKRRKETYYEWVPVPPVNLDRLYLRAVIGIAVLLTLVAVVWSTAAIGRLLGGMVPGYEEVGFIGALAFEIPWVACLMVQWILRDQPDRAKPVNIAGWIGLGVVVGAVITDGVTLGMPEVGVVAAFVSIVAKGLWWVVLRLFHVPLDEDHAGWLAAKRQEMAVSRVMLGEQQRMGAMEAWMSEVYGVRPGATPIAQRVATELPAAGQAREVSGQPSGTVSGQVNPPPVPPVPPVPPASGRDTDTSGDTSGQGDEGAADPEVRQISVPGIAAICRTEIAGDPAVTDAALHAAVLAAGHRDRPNLADTVRRTALRIDPTRRKTP